MQNYTANNQLKKKYPKDTEVYFEIRTERDGNIMSALFDDGDFSTVMRGIIENTRDDISSDDWDEMKEDMLGEEEEEAGAEAEAKKGADE